MLLLCIGSLDNQFGGSVTMDCIVHLVLNLLEKDTGSWRIRIVVDGSSVNISNLLVEATFAKSDFPDFF